MENFTWEPAAISALSDNFESIATGVAKKVAFVRMVCDAKLNAAHLIYGIEDDLDTKKAFELQNSRWVDESIAYYTPSVFPNFESIKERSLMHAARALFVKQFLEGYYFQGTFGKKEICTNKYQVIKFAKGFGFDSILNIFGLAVGTKTIKCSGLSAAAFWCGRMFAMDDESVTGVAVLYILVLVGRVNSHYLLWFINLCLSFYDKSKPFIKNVYAGKFYGTPLSSEQNRAVIYSTWSFSVARAVMVTSDLPGKDGRFIKSVDLLNPEYLTAVGFLLSKVFNGVYCSMDMLSEKFVSLMRFADDNDNA